jgi:hypothetical protein
MLQVIIPWKEKHPHHKETMWNFLTPTWSRKLHLGNSPEKQRNFWLGVEQIGYVRLFLQPLFKLSIDVLTWRNWILGPCCLAFWKEILSFRIAFFVKSLIRGLKKLSWCQMHCWTQQILTHEWFFWNKHL